MIDILHFVLYGRLGDVEIGVNEKFVRSVLGEPLHFEPAQKSYPAFFLYGPLELRFRNGSLIKNCSGREANKRFDGSARKMNSRRWRLWAFARASEIFFESEEI